MASGDAAGAGTRISRSTRPARCTATPRTFLHAQNSAAAEAAPAAGAGGGPQPQPPQGDPPADRRPQTEAVAAPAGAEGAEGAPAGAASPPTDGAAGGAAGDLMLMGYHKIRGLGAPLRMMFYYKEQKYTDVAYGADMGAEWFGKKKLELATKNSCINLPYIIDGDTLLTQSNTCFLYVGKKLGIDEPDHFFKNHCVLDQVMDLRNDLINIVYHPPIRDIVKTKEEWPEACKKHMEGKAKMYFEKLEGFCTGPYMCGATPQSGDFHVFEMVDQHHIMCEMMPSLGMTGDANIVKGFPKLQALRAAMKADPKLAKYFAADCYTKWAHNNALFTHFIGQGDGFDYGPTVEQVLAA